MLFSALVSHFPIVNEYHYYFHSQKFRVGRARRTTNRLGVALAYTLTRPLGTGRLSWEYGTGKKEVACVKTYCAPPKLASQIVYGPLHG